MQALRVKSNGIELQIRDGEQDGDAVFLLDQRGHLNRMLRLESAVDEI